MIPGCRMARVWITSLLACTTLASGSSRAEPVKLLPGPFELPERIGPMRFDGQAHKYDDPRLGSSYQYMGGGLSLTVYVYDLGATDIPDGGDTRIACEAFEGAKSDVMHAGYQDTLLKSQQLARLDPDAVAPVAREAVFEFTRSGSPTVSYLWVTGAAKQFVKLRFSVNAKYRDELVEARRAVLTALGESLKPHLGPVDADAKKKNAQINVSAANSPDEVGTAVKYVISLTAAVEDHPEIQPVCGGELVPDFGDELAAFQGLLTVSKPPGRETKFTRRLAEIADASFLDEFVWTYRHQESWGSQPPDGLQLSAFDQWRKKKLKRFKVPDFGNVSYDTPRPLPLEPAEPAIP
jgi:hypothetical protein